MFNGVGINLTRLGLNTPSNANEFMYVGRVTADLLGKPGYPEGDMAFSTTPQFAVGTSHGYNAGLQTNTTGAGSNNQISTAFASIGNGRLLNQGVVNIGTTGIDAVFKYKGLSLQAEGFVRNIDTRDHSKRIGNASGFLCAGRVFRAVWRTIEFVGRYSYMDPDTLRSEDTITSGVGGINWYLSGHEHKLQFDYWRHHDAVECRRHGNGRGLADRKSRTLTIHDCVLRTSRRRAVLTGRSEPQIISDSWLEELGKVLALSRVHGNEVHSDLSKILGVFGRLGWGSVAGTECGRRRCN